MVPSFFLPLRFVRVPCSLWNILPVSSLFPSYMPPLRLFLCIQPTLLQCLVPTIVRPPSSVRRRATNPPALADQFPLLVSRPSVPYAGLHPPPTCVDGGTWLGCGWRGEGDGAPRGGLESVVSSAGVACLCDTRRSISLLILAVPISLLSTPPPPSPFPRTTVRVPLLSLLTGEFFMVTPRSPAPLGPAVLPAVSTSRVPVLFLPLPIPMSSSQGRVVP